MADDKKNELTTSTALTAIDPFDWEPDDLVPSTNEDDGELRRMRHSTAMLSQDRSPGRLDGRWHRGEHVK
jgi:hypothetical protein